MTSADTPHPLILIVGAAFGAAGVFLTATTIGREIVTMEGQHWIMLLIALVVGYVLGRIWTQPAQIVGLP